MRVKPTLELAMTVLLFVIGCRAVAAPASSAALPELDRLADSLCDKRVVLLGEEGHHAAGRSIEIKTELLERLVDRCGFSAVFFESDVYEFLDLERAAEQGKATRERLADAIGGLWSTTAESEPLVDYLFERLRKRSLRVDGVDPQVGGATQLYTQRGLGADLALPLPASQAKVCEPAIEQLTQWKYEHDDGYETARPVLLDCARASEAAYAKRHGSDAERFRRMAISLRHYLDFPEGDRFNARDRAMYENLTWHLHRLRAREKAIVWCASVHAARRATSESRHPMGELLYRDLGALSAVVAVDALAGSYGRRSPEPITSARDSVEAALFAGGTGDMRIAVGPSLAALDGRPAHFMNFDMPAVARWSDFVDAIVVVRSERPPRYVRDARPRRAWSDKSEAGGDIR